MAAIITIGLLALSAARFLIFFDVVVGADQAFVLVAQLLGAFMPHYLAFMLPFAVYWATYMTVRDLTLSSELAVLQAAGVSLFRAFMPLVVLGLILTCVNIIVVGWLEPMGRYTYRSLIFEVEKTAFFLKARDNTFLELGAKTVLVEKINSDRRNFDSIFIFEARDGGQAMTITATRGEIINGEERLVLRLYDGQKLDLKKADGKESVQSMDFERLDVPLDRKATHFRERGDDASELVLTELATRSEGPNGTTPLEMITAFNRKLVIALSPLVLPLLAACLATLNPRRKSAYLAAFALLIVLAYHQAVEFGAELSNKQGLNPVITVWPPFLVLAASSAFLFYAVNKRPGLIEGYFSSLWRSAHGRAERRG